jgi:hypothetical protein
MWRPGDDGRWLGARDLEFFYTGRGFRSNDFNRWPSTGSKQNHRPWQPRVAACLRPSAMHGQGCHPVHHPKCVRPQNSPSLGKSESCQNPVPSTVLCSKRNIILGWLIALRARASHARNVGLGLWLDSKLQVGRTRKSSEQAAPRRGVGETSNSRLSRLGSLKCLCLFSSVATSIDLNWSDCRQSYSIYQEPDWRWFTDFRAECHRWGLLWQ